MGTSPETQPTLLLELRDGADQQSWSTFTDLYAPLIYAFLSKRGVQDADAADLTQEVMMSVASSLRTFDYDREKGTFRSWLLTVVHNRLRNFRRKKGLGVHGEGGTHAYEMLMEQPTASDDDWEAWDKQYHSRLFQFAADQVRGDFQESTWSAFWRTCVEGESTKDVAADLGISAPAVYMAKRRVVARIKDQVQFLGGDQE